MRPSRSPSASTFTLGERAVMDGATGHSEPSSTMITSSSSSGGEWLMTDATERRIVDSGSSTCVNMTDVRGMRSSSAFVYAGMRWHDSGRRSGIVRLDGSESESLSAKWNLSSMAMSFFLFFGSLR